MNPFDLRGPEFLAFYAALGALTLVVVWVLRRMRESEISTVPILNDYLEIAYLRGGSNEALRAATMNLVNRGLIEVATDDRLQTADPTAAARVSKHSERGILEKFSVRSEASTLFSDRELKAAAAADCEPNLTRLRLLPDAAMRTARNTLLFAAVLILVFVAATKVLVALSRGRTNVLLLIAEAVLFCVLAYKTAQPFRTPAGDAQLKDLLTLFEGLKARAAALRPGAQTDDFALLVAVFGINVLPPAFSFDRIFQRARAKATSSCGSGCGSSSSSCGSGCGGGGGGCGGCGS